MEHTIGYLFVGECENSSSQVYTTGQLAEYSKFDYLKSVGTCD
jgi:hypothetical protein